MKRGEVWTVAGGPDYAGKPRPAIILQSDKFDATLSITICPLTSTLVDAEPARFAIAPSKANGLLVMSHAMIDKISTVPKRTLLAALVDWSPAISCCSTNTWRSFSA